MESIISLLTVDPPVPLAGSLIGAACGVPHMDSMRDIDLDAYLAWLCDAKETTVRPGSAWRRRVGSPEVAYGFGLSFERICCSLVRASDLLSHSKAEAALEASNILVSAASVSALWRSDLREAWPELGEASLRRDARLARCAAHAHGISTLPDGALKAGLTRSLAAECAEVCRSAAVLAEAEALRCSALVHSSAGELEAAVACASRASGLVKRPEYLQFEDALRAAASRLPDGLRGPRVPPQMCPAVPLPVI